jgi:hypothetical protein
MPIITKTLSVRIRDKHAKVFAHMVFDVKHRIFDPQLSFNNDTVRDKPSRSWRGRIARTAWPSLPFGFSVSFK